MGVHFCPRCNKPYAVAFGVTDFVHTCNSGNDTLDQEDIIQLEKQNWNWQGVENSLSNRAKVEGQRLGNLTDRGVSADTHKTRQHEEYIDLGGK